MFHQESTHNFESTANDNLRLYEKTERTQLIVQIGTHLKNKGITYLTHIDAFMWLLSADLEVLSQLKKDLIDCNDAPILEIDTPTTANGHPPSLSNNIPTLDELEQGPINKASSTRTLENLLEKIDRNTKMRFDNENYMLTLSAQNEEINLSFLINNANLSHLTLSDELITKLNEFLVRLGFTTNAIEIYRKLGYHSINRLFRQEAIHSGITADSGPDSQNMLVCFIYGCLINDALNKMPVITNSDEKTDALDRGELLTRKEEETARRTNNPTRFPALTSFSNTHGFLTHFLYAGNTRTKLANAPRTYKIGEDFEKEVLFPQGTQVITQKKSGYLLSTFVRSPALEPMDHYLSDLALNYVFTHMDTGYNGLAHTYRVMLGIELVRNYFAHYALDPEFKLFCQSLGNNDIEWLRITAAFSTTGKEGEIYRKASADHFLNFVGKTKSLDSKLMQDRMHYIVRLGDLNEEHTLQNFYHRILTVAHKLDLVRCYGPGQYENSMNMCVKLSEQSDQQTKAYHDMIKYFVDLNKAHGDRLLCDIDSIGELVVADENYQPIFSEVSLSQKRLREVTETVPKPKLSFVPCCLTQLKVSD